MESDGPGYADHNLFQVGYMPWMMKIRIDLPFLEGYVDRARRFLTITKAQANARLVGEQDGSEHKDVVSGLLKAKKWTTGKDFTTPELVSESVLLLIAGQ